MHAGNGTHTQPSGHGQVAAPGRDRRAAEQRAPSRGEERDQSAARHVASGVARLGLVARAEAWQARGRTGLTPTQAQILSLLRAAEPEPLTLRAIAEGLAVTSATASESLETLVGKGMAVRGRSARDARALAVRLTDAGRSEADAGGTSNDALLAAAGDIAETDQAAFLRGLTRMIRRLEEDGRIAPARMCATCRYFRPNTHTRSDDAPHHCTYVDAPFGDRQLRIDCGQHDRADPDLAERNWQTFIR